MTDEQIPAEPERDRLYWVLVPDGFMPLSGLMGGPDLSKWGPTPSREVVHQMAKVMKGVVVGVDVTYFANQREVCGEETDGNHGA